MVDLILAQKKAYQEIESSYWALMPAEVAKKLGRSKGSINYRSLVGEVHESTFYTMFSNVFGKTVGFQNNGPILTTKGDELKFDVRAYLEYPGYIEQYRKERLKKFPWDLPKKLRALAYLYKAEPSKLSEIAEKTRTTIGPLSHSLSELKANGRVVSIYRRWKLSKREMEIWGFLEKSLKPWKEFKKKHRAPLKSTLWKYSKTENNFYTKLFKALS